MSEVSKVHAFKSLSRLSGKFRGDLKEHDFILLYAFNGTGKTRLSMEFKELGKQKNDGNPDTLYFNAFTEDLFHWDNDLETDTVRTLLINSKSNFFSAITDKALDMEGRIFKYLERYADFDFKIDYDNWRITFSRNVIVRRKQYFQSVKVDDIKISRGEETIFIWCVFLAICELAIEEKIANVEGSYAWVKYVYVDDPISSLDDNNAIAVASDLAQLLKKGHGHINTVISSHHGLFFNVVYNELNESPFKSERFCLHQDKTASGIVYKLQKTGDSPFFHHLVMLKEMKVATKTGKLYTYHFNMLRSIMEKTASFFGFENFSSCIDGIKDEVLYARALNLLSHGKYSFYEPREMVDDTKNLFKRILKAFLDRYEFQLDKIFVDKIKKQS